MRPLPSAPPVQPLRPQRAASQAGPQLLPARPRSQARHSVLALWHLLSLDAPTIAAVWTAFIALCAGLTLRWTEPAAMFVAVWMIYAADRLLDARLLDGRPLDATLLLDAPLPAGAAVLPAANSSSDPSPGARGRRRSTSAQCELEARHRFHHRYRGRFLIAIVGASLALVFLLQHIGNSALHLYTLLAALLASWLLLIHVRPSPTHALRRLPKELAVGIFFPAAVFIPTVARVPWLRPVLLLDALLFAGVCTLNCLFVYAWEHPAPRLNAHWTTRWATDHLTHLAVILCALASLSALPNAWQALSRATLCIALHPLFLSIAAPPGALLRGPALACALSAALLLLLHLLRRGLSAVHLRASADLVLLTPLLLLPVLRHIAP